MPMNRFFTILTLALTGSICQGAAEVPSHIVQPLPKDLDPRLAPEFQAPKQFARPLTPEEQSRRASDLAPVPSAPLDADGKKAIETYAAQDKEVDQQIERFQKDVGLNIHATATTEAPSKTPPASPAANPDEATITNATCDEGVYFDAEQGMLVFMKNVSIKNPRFSLDCTGPLKIYLEADASQKPEKEVKPKEKADSESKVVLPGGGNFNFNDMKKAAASGNVVLHFTNDEGKIFTAKADQLTYNAKTGEVILTGNYPSISDGNNTMTSRAKNGFIRVYENGNVYFSNGANTTIRNLDTQRLNKDKPKGAKKP